MRLAPVPFSLLLVFTTLAASLHPLRAFGTSFLQRARRPTLCRRMETLAGVTLPDVKTKHLTLVLVRQVSDQGVPQLLLGMKKRGFGKGKYNGFGGKVEPGETIEQAALRELLEESCLKAERVRKRGDLAFLMAGPEVLRVHVFEPEGLSGEPKETDEMAPRYFPESEIPYQDMWADDIYWLPIFLRGRRFEGVFEFEEDEKTIIRYELKEVEE